MLEMKEITEVIYIDKISDIDTKVVGIDSFLIYHPSNIPKYLT